MRRLLNTVYVTSTGTYLSKDGTNVVFSVDHEERGRLPIHNIENIVTFGAIGCSPYLMKMCADEGVDITFLTNYGRFMCKVTGPIKGSVHLRREQFRVANEEEESLKIAQNIIKGKFINCKNVLRRGRSDHSDKIDASSFIRCEQHIKTRIKDIDHCTDYGSLMGIEGEVAKAYFQCVDDLVLQQKEDFFLRNRSRRPPLDNMNSVLSFLYTILANDVRSSLESVGLDPYVGFYHKDRSGRPSLALDLMEELRPFMVDRLVLSLINMNMIKGDGFEKTESGGVEMDDKTRLKVLDAWQKRKRNEVTHPFLQEKIPIGLLPHVQSLLLSRHLRGDIDGYPPFISN